MLDRALEREADAHRLLLEGDEDGAREPLREAAELYRGSWEQAGPRSFGRLIGMLKAAVLGGAGGEEAAYVRRELGGEADSPVASYALALACVVEGDDERARAAAAGMRGGSEPLDRAADAIEAIASGDREGYGDAVSAIVADFEARDQHVTGVPIADTALMLQRLAARRGMAADLDSPLLPG